MYVSKTRKEKFVAPGDRVARWFIFKPKIPIWVNFVGTWIGKC
jgi:hypothetical protein